MRPRWRRGLAVLIPLLLLAGAPSRGAGPPDAPAPLGYVCHRLTAPIRVDGKLDDAAWQAVPWTSAFVDIEGAARPAPRFRTRARMAWDDRFFYIAAEMEEPHVGGSLTKHDAVIFQDNDFEVFIDPDGDNHAYYEFEINALNTGWDLLLVKPYRDGGPAKNEWEIPGLLTAVAVDGTLNDPGDIDRGWSVELAFPWTALAEYARRPSPPRDGDTWRVNFSRVEWEWEAIEGGYRKVPGRKEDNWVWSPQGAIDMHRPERWGFVQFTTKPPGASVPFRPDPAWPAREVLMRAYHAQAAYKQRHGRWARSLAELALPSEASRPGPTLGPIALEITADGYRASVESRPPGGTPRRWIVEQDSRLRPDPE
jgi:hypothetical protein